VGGGNRALSLQQAKVVRRRRNDDLRVESHMKFITRNKVDLAKRRKLESSQPLEPNIPFGEKTH